MQGYFELTINGESQRVEGESANATLLDYLRRHGSTAAKSGCSDGGCGTCTVVVVALDGRGKAAFRSVNACLVRLPMLAGCEIWTLEGLAASPGLHPVQQQLAEKGATQCGFCAPGIVMSLFEGYYREDLVTLEDVHEQLAGNLCRCTGYRSIRDAAVKALREGAARREAGVEMRAVARTLPVAGETPAVDGFGFTEVLANAGRAAEQPAELEYIDRDQGRFSRPKTVTEMLRLLHQFPQARLVSGGTSLPPGLDDAAAGSGFLIGTGGIPELQLVLNHGEYWEIGAAVTLTAMSEALNREYPALDKLLARFGGRQLRNLATVGGNLASAAHNGDLAPMLVALEARVRLASLEGERELPLADFFVAYRQTALRENEILKCVLLPRLGEVALKARGAVVRLTDFYKVSKRRAVDRSVANAGFCVWLDAEGNVVEARLVYGGIGAFASRATEVERELVGKVWSRATAAAAAERLRVAYEPVDDLLASATYQRSLLRNLFLKFYFDHPAAEEVGTLAGEDLVERYLSQPVVPRQSKSGTGGSEHPDPQAQNAEKPEEIAAATKLAEAPPEDGEDVTQTDVEAQAEPEPEPEPEPDAEPERDAEPEDKDQPGLEQGTDSAEKVRLPGLEPARQGVFEPRKDVEAVESATDTESEVEQVSFVARPAEAVEPTAGMADEAVGEPVKEEAAQAPTAIAKSGDVLQPVPLAKKTRVPEEDGPPSPNDELVAASDGKDEDAALSRRWRRSGSRRGPARNQRRRSSRRRKSK